MADTDKLAKLREIRNKKDIQLRPTKYLRKTVKGLDGTEKPLTLRYYQVQMIMNLLAMPRFIVGDDTGLGKTIECISSLCYLWDKYPEIKALVLTKKSALRQWADEFGKFTEGVRVVTCRGTAAQRKAALEEFDATPGPVVLVMGHRSAVQDFTNLQGRIWDALIIDECFDYHTPIMLADGTSELIGRIVSKKMPVQVLSYDHATGTIQPRSVTGWFRNPRHQGGLNGRRMVRIGFRYSGRAASTTSHQFYRPDGTKVLAKKLRVGDQTLHLCANYPTDIQKQVVFGSLLGDACVSMPKRMFPGVQFGHCVAQIELLKFKHRLLVPLGTSDVTVYENGGFEKKDKIPKLHGKFRLNGNAAIAEIIDRSKMIRGGKKRISPDWLDEVGPLGLAIWYADDGSLQSHTRADGTITYEVNLSTNDFPFDDQLMLVGWLRWKFGVEATVRFSKKRTDRDVGQVKVYPYIHIGQQATTKFFALLPGAIPGVEYKFPPGTPLINEADLAITPTYGLVVDTVTSKEPWLSVPKEQFVYDIEVEGNHNYFANGTLVSNCTVAKNPKSQMHQVCQYLSAQSKRSWGLTATLIKNNLLEGYGIMRVVDPTVFQMSESAFIDEYCVTELVNVGRGRKIKQVVGYRRSGVNQFRDKIEMAYLGRPKHAVASELPILTSKTVKVGMSDVQKAKYQEALSGILQMGDGEEKETTKLTQVTYCQEIANHPKLIGVDGTSEKLDSLVDMLTDGDLEGEKVIVFTKYEKMVGLGVEALEAKGVKCVRITGKEDEDGRKAAQDQFQDFNSPVKVVWITTAGSDAINLQAASAIVFYDLPFSAGDFLQCLGRMIRIGSVHSRVFAINLIADRTVDERVNELLTRKMVLLEAVLGKRIKDEDLTDDVILDGDNMVEELFQSLKEAAQEYIDAR